MLPTRNPPIRRIMRPTVRRERARRFVIHRFAPLVLGPVVQRRAQLDALVERPEETRTDVIPGVAG